MRIAGVPNDLRNSLPGELVVTLSTELRRANAEAYPPGARDYTAEFHFHWRRDFESDNLDKAEKTILALAKQAGVDVGDDVVPVRAGYAHIVVVDLLDNSLYDALDAREADLEYLASVLLTDNEIDEELDSSLAGIGTYAILVNSVYVEPPWRGRAFGLLGTGLALAELRRGCSFAALDAVEPGATDDAERARSHQRLRQYWQRLGFSPFRDRVLTLDLGTTQFDEAMRELGAI